MSKSIVRNDLETKLKTWAATQSPVPPIAFEGCAFVKPDTTPWLECFLIPNVSFNRETTASHQTLYGLFQVNVWTRKGTGMADGETLADSLAAAFPVVPKTGLVSIEKPPTVEKPMPDDSGWNILPVLMSYRYEV